MNEFADLYQWIATGIMRDPAILVLLFAGICIAAFILVMVRHAKARSTEDSLASMRVEAEHFFSDLANRKRLPIVSVDIVLKEGEVGILQEPSTLMETRAFRVYGGGGTRIRGIYIGGGASESHQRLRQIDSGKLTLTNQRLVFDGDNENRSVKLSDVLSAKAWQDAIEVSTSKRQKSQIYTVQNPLIWAEMIQNLASGKIEIPVGARVEEIPNAKDF